VKAQLVLQIPIELIPLEEKQQTSEQRTHFKNPIRKNSECRFLNAELAKQSGPTFFSNQQSAISIQQFQHESLRRLHHAHDRAEHLGKSRFLDAELLLPGSRESVEARSPVVR
jgi:hypothetical protein